MKSVIFDLDGTVILTESLHRRSFNKVLKELGVNLSQEKWDSFKGKGTIKIFKTIINENNLDVDLNEIVSARDKCFDELINLEGIPLVNGFRKFYSLLIEKGVKVIIGTCGRNINVEKELSIDRLKIPFVSADDVDKTKPSPDIFLLAAKKLGVEPSNCVVFEDAKSGIIAGHRAGMKVIGVCQSSSLDELSDADFIIEDYSELDWEQISKILS